MKRRLVILDCMQGIAMILVVLGHFQTGSFVPSWYPEYMRGYIYSFHMALFFFISGFLATYSYHSVSSLKQYGFYVWRKFKKFSPPFVILGFLCIAFTLAFEHKSGNHNLTDGVKRLFLAPRTSYSGYLWYIYLLFIFYCILPLLLSKKKKTLSAGMFFSLFLLFFPIRTQLFALDHFSRFLFFFLMGVVCCINRDKIKKYSLYICYAGAIMFFLWSVSFFIIGGEPYSFGGGVLSIPACAAFSCLLLRKTLFAQILTVISKNCFWIYLLHLFVIQFFIKILSLFTVSTNSFIPFMILVTPLSIGIPIIMRKVYTVSIQYFQKKRVKTCASHG